MPTKQCDQVSVGTKKSLKGQNVTIYLVKKNKKKLKLSTKTEEISVDVMSKTTMYCVTGTSTEVSMLTD